MPQLSRFGTDAHFFSLCAAAFLRSPGRLVRPSPPRLVAPFARPASTSALRLSAGSPARPALAMARSTRLSVSPLFPRIALRSSESLRPVFAREIRAQRIFLLTAKLGHQVPLSMVSTKNPSSDFFVRAPLLLRFSLPRKPRSLASGGLRATTSTLFLGSRAAIFHLDFASQKVRPADVARQQSSSTPTSCRLS